MTGVGQSSRPEEFEGKRRPLLKGLVDHTIEKTVEAFIVQGRDAYVVSLQLSTAKINNKQRSGSFPLT